jgi:hypothetical protein
MKPNLNMATLLFAAICIALALCIAATAQPAQQEPAQQSWPVIIKSEKYGDIEVTYTPANEKGGLRLGLGIPMDALNITFGDSEITFSLIPPRKEGEVLPITFDDSRFLIMARISKSGKIFSFNAFKSKGKTEGEYSDLNVLPPDEVDAWNEVIEIAKELKGNSNIWNFEYSDEFKQEVDNVIRGKYLPASSSNLLRFSYIIGYPNIADTICFGYVISGSEFYLYICTPDNFEETTPKLFVLYYDECRESGELWLEIDPRNEQCKALLNIKTDHVEPEALQDELATLQNALRSLQINHPLTKFDIYNKLDSFIDSALKGLTEFPIKTSDYDISTWTEKTNEYQEIP